MMGASVSRVASRVSSREQRESATALRRVLAARMAAQDLLDVGAYQPGSNPLVDAALTHETAIARFLQQGEPLTAEDVRSVVFAAQRGGYSETQVDLVLDAVIDILLAVKTT